VRAETAFHVERPAVVVLDVQRLDGDAILRDHRRPRAISSRSVSYGTRPDCNWSFCDRTSVDRRGSLMLAEDRVTVESLHVEDNNGRPLDVKGSLGTHELRVGDVEIDATARRFEILRNQLGHVEVDVMLQIRGRFESPRVTGDITFGQSELKVDEILDRTLFQPYSTEQTVTTQVDAVAASTPGNGWDSTSRCTSPIR